MANVLELQAIRKQYGGGNAPIVEVLHGIDFSLQEGEFVALTGPSGSGKSTLLNLMGLLERPSQGELLIAEQATSPLDDNQRTALRNRYLGFVFQFHHLLPAFSAMENVLMPMFAGQGKRTRAMEERALFLLERVGLAAHAHKKPVQLSGGQQQRVAIVRALANQPRLVLADEPTGNLDHKSADSIYALMCELNADLGTAFVVVTHDRALAARLHRRISLVDGLVVEAQ